MSLQKVSALTVIALSLAACGGGSGSPTAKSAPTAPSVKPGNQSKNDEAKKAEEKRKAEEARKAEEKRKAEEARKAAEALTRRAARAGIGGGIWQSETAGFDALNDLNAKQAAKAV